MKNLVRSYDGLTKTEFKSPYTLKISEFTSKYVGRKILPKASVDKFIDKITVVLYKMGIGILPFIIESKIYEPSKDTLIIRICEVYLGIEGFQNEIMAKESIKAVIEMSLSLLKHSIDENSPQKAG